MDIDSLRARARNAVAWSIIERWVATAFTFGVIVVLARLLEPNDFGLVALASAFTFIIQMLVGQGMGDALIQRRTVEREHLNTVFWTGLVLSAACTVAMYFSADTIARVVNEPQLASLLRWLSFSFVLKALTNVQEAWLRRELAFRDLTMRSVVATTGGGLAAIAFAFAGYGAFSLVAQQLIHNIVALLVLWKVSNWQPGLRVSLRHLADLYAFGFRTLGIQLVNAIQLRADDLLIGSFLGPTALGYYNIAFRLYRILTALVVSVTGSALFSAFSRLREYPGELRRAYGAALRYTALIVFPVFLGMAAAATHIVPVIYGVGWYPSIPVMQVFGPLGIVSVFLFFNGAVLKAIGRPGRFLLLNLGFTVCMFAAFAIAGGAGIAAFAATYASLSLIMLPLIGWTMTALIGISVRDLLGDVWAPLVSAVLMVGGIAGFQRVAVPGVPTVLSLIISILAGGILYTAGMWLFAPGLVRHVWTVGFRVAVPQTRTVGRVVDQASGGSSV